MKQLLKAVLIAAALVVLIKVFAFTSCTIPSTGMENSLLRGERVIVNKWSYGLRLPLMGMTGYHRLAARGVERGDIVLFNNPAGKGTIDRRELFINRCIGLPGDTLMLNGQLIQTRDQVLSPDSKLVYAYPGEQEDLVVEAMRRVGIGDNKLVGFDRGDFLRSFSHYEIYLMRQELRGQVTFRSLQTDTADGVHPFVVPARGKAVKVYPWNAKLLCNTIVQHEGRQARLQGDTLWVDGRRVTSYTFKKDYHWVASNNSVSLCDSRLFGFVPDDHIIGRASLIWFSKDTEEPFWHGFRWKRFFRLVQ
ncbi:signal peptidase I [Bacteroides sp. Marseille-P3684]|uniref:signal peptidase I n=1 Tax=Bacteroides sp. Marseille-P3684 TaxID=2086579 RepID=UPI000D0BC5AC|nr:signal peptidase I [Bacteroides sp. Marseille-P3684]